jgi:hypothetical protein
MDEKRVNRQSGCVYFLKAEGLGLIKIGIAADVASRLAALQTGSPDNLVLLGVIRSADPRALERHLHEEFGASRVRGEWFEPTPELIARIEQDAERYDDDICRLAWEAQRKRFGAAIPAYPGIAQLTRLFGKVA